MLIDQVGLNIKEAMKNKDKDRLEILRYLKSMLIENKTSTKPKEELEVVISLSKKLKDSLEMYPEGHQAREKAQREIKVLKDFLPQELSQDEVKEFISNIMNTLENPNMGSIMKELSPKIKGRFDGKMASQLVKKALI